ncbi:OLC1v1025725C1 [Oldenlandia corymbosa var. corymbosa]|uniref:OLC1v1025725C1 n=1 Tax=Oldenlandia corymbosa var. corymbosa TaxID=529605 RepID=A0AAV1C5T5_OLDCO|nr:OLC1v1025725C1 [Oldenlandia corymbosa var. corymbosa]
MAPSHFTNPFRLSTFLLLAVIIFSTEPTNSISTPSSNPSSSVEDVLKAHALPIGIFPKLISGFSLDPASGMFQLQVANSPCDAKFETPVRYDVNVTGVISYGKISDLSGVASQELFLWLPVKGIKVDVPSSGLIYFDVGVVSKQFSLSLFETPHDCSAPAAEEGANDHDDQFPATLDLSFLKSRKRDIENPSEKFLKERYNGQEQRATS